MQSFDFLSRSRRDGELQHHVGSVARVSKEFCQITAAEGEGRLLEELDLRRGSLVSQAREEARGECPVASSLSVSLK